MALRKRKEVEEKKAEVKEEQPKAKGFESIVTNFAFVDKRK